MTIFEAAGALSRRKLRTDGHTGVVPDTHHTQGRDVPDQRRNVAVSKHGQGRIAGVRTKRDVIGLTTVVRIAFDPVDRNEVAAPWSVGRNDRDPFILHREAGSRGRGQGVRQADVRISTRREIEVVIGPRHIPNTELGTTPDLVFGKRGHNIEKHMLRIALCCLVRVLLFAVRDPELGILTAVVCSW